MSIIFYAFSIPDSFVMVYSSRYNNFLNLGINSIYTGDYVRNSGYKSNNVNPNFIWGQKNLPIDLYTQYGEDFKAIFSNGDIGFFIAFHNTGINSHSKDINKKMFCFISQYFKEHLNADEIYDLTNFCPIKILKKLKIFCAIVIFILL